jgi:hypothetical protein
MVSFVIDEVDFVPEIKYVVENYVQSFIDVFKEDSDLYMGFYSKNRAPKSDLNPMNFSIIEEKNEKIVYFFHSLSKFFQSLLIG